MLKDPVTPVKRFAEVVIGICLMGECSLFGLFVKLDVLRLANVEWRLGIIQSRVDVGMGRRPSCPPQATWGYGMKMPHLSRLIGSISASLTLVMGLACFSSSSNAIVYVSSVDGDTEVLLLDAKSGESVSLTNNGSADYGPRLSPDGKQIAFLSDESGDLEINVVDRKTETLIRLTHEEGDDLSPRWSPDGERLAFISHRDGQPEVYLMNADGSSPTRITSNSSEEFLGDWSPDGVWLVFNVLGGEEERGLWVRNPDGVNLVRLTTGLDYSPLFSPDGQRIVFVRGEGGEEEIYTLSRLKRRTWHDEPELTRLTQNDVSDRTASWSTDSKSIVFVSSRDGNSEVYTMRGDGSKQVRLTNNEVEDLTPVWSRDGKRIAFVSHLYGEGEIFVMGSDGINQLRLTNNSSEDQSPNW